MQLTDELMDRLYRLEKSLKASGMGELSPVEIRRAVSSQNAPMNSSLAPMGRPYMSPPLGFQGNSVFPNESGSGVLQPWQVPPPQSAELMNTRGRPVGPPMQTQGWFPSPDPREVQVAQGMQFPGQSDGFGGMDLNVRLGPDGKPRQLLLRRLSANARRQV